MRSAPTSRATRKATASRCATTSISSGLTEIIEGTSIYKRFHNVFASEYWFEAYDLPYPKRVITDTGKTQYLFRINKGVEDLGESINQHMPEARAADPVRQHDLLRRRRHRRAVDGGDAQERRPCGGRLSAGQVGKAKCVDLFKAGRCDFFAPADYRAGSDLFKRTCLLLDRILADIRVQEEMWRMGRGLK